MNFQVFHVNPGKKLKKKDVNNDLSHFMPVFPSMRRIRLNSRILLNKKNRRKFNLLGNRRVHLFRRNVKVQAHSMH